MQNCESFYLSKDSNKFENVSSYMDGMVNEVSFLNMSDVGLLLKVFSLESQYQESKNDSYFQTQLVDISKEEKNELFKDIFQLILDSYKSQMQIDSDVFEKIFSDYKEETLALYFKRFKELEEFIEIIYSGKDNPNYTLKTKRKKGFFELNDEEFHSILWYYAKIAKRDGILGMMGKVQEEHHFFKNYFGLMIDGHSPDDIKDFLEKETKYFQSEIDKKVEIVKLSVLKYLLSMKMIIHELKLYQIEEQLKSFFDRVIVEELFKYANTRVKASKPITKAVFPQEKVDKDEKIIELKTDTKVYDIFEFENKNLVLVEKNMITTYREDGVKLESFIYDDSLKFENNQISFMLNSSIITLDENLKS